MFAPAAAAAGGSSSRRRRKQQQQAEAAAGGSSSSRRQQQQQKEAAAAAAAEGSSNSSRRQQQQQQQQQQQEAAARSSKQAASKQQASSKQAESKQKAATSVCPVERIMKYNISFINQRNTKIELVLGARPQNNEIVQLPKGCGDAKLELFPGARPPDTTSTSWYDLTLGLVGSNRIMSTKHCAQRWKSVRINNPSNKELSKSIRNTARTQVWYDFRSIDTT